MSKKTKPKLIDRLIYVAAIVEPVVAIPQVYQIFHGRTAAGISISTWAGYDVLSLVWLWYGFAHKEKVIIFYQSSWLVLQSVILIGAALYGGKW